MGTARWNSKLLGDEVEIAFIERGRDSKKSRGGAMRGRRRRRSRYV
jgi:hypothetical protein